MINCSVPFLGRNRHTLRPAPRTKYTQKPVRFASKERRYKRPVSPFDLPSANGCAVVAPARSHQGRGQASAEGDGRQGVAHVALCQPDVDGAGNASRTVEVVAPAAERESEREVQ